MKNKIGQSHRTDPLILKDVCAWFENGEKRLSVFWGVSFELKPGEILGIFGPNGSGKSTLLRTIAGVHRTMTGEIIYPRNNGKEVRISILPQAFKESFFEWASLRTNLLMTCHDAIKKRKENRKLIERLKDELDLDLDFKLRPGQCSGGMLQQASMIRTFVNDPDILIADEPFSALDVKVASRIRRSFRQILKQRQIIGLVVLHDLESIVEVCDKVFVISGKPYSTAAIQNHEKAIILKNHHVIKEGEASGEELADREKVKKRSFLEIMEDILEWGKTNGTNA